MTQIVPAMDVVDYEQIFQTQERNSIVSRKLFCIYVFRLTFYWKEIALIKLINWNIKYLYATFL